MQKISTLDLGSNDAENYKRRERKQFFESVFVRTSALDEICDPKTSFIVGEKGTGKTAYAVFISNTSYMDNFSATRSIRETEFLKFITLKSKHHLELSDYSNIWKVIIYLLLSQQILSKETRFTSLNRLTKFAQFKNVIDEYYDKAFSPEIVNALQFVERSGIAAGLMTKFLNVSGSTEEEQVFSESNFQTNLLYIQRRFEEIFRASRLSRNHMLFIDGIDVRPHSVPYEDYLTCIKGLANAVWEVNTDIFSNIKDSPGRLRVVLLIRPDIFQFLGLQNQNAKIRDNSVILDWRTSENEFRNSKLFEVVDRLLIPKNGTARSLGKGWDSFFPTNAPNPFITLLGLSFHRPRDFVSMLGTLQEVVLDSGAPHKNMFSSRDISSAEFLNGVSDYLLGEIKDQILFYWSLEEYNIFLKFFEFLYGGTSFSYAEYEEAYSLTIGYIDSEKVDPPTFMKSSSQFLQFLYDLNVICWVEQTELNQKFFRWCFRERRYSNISPRVRLGADYEIYRGLRRALNLGVRVRK